MRFLDNPLREPLGLTAGRDGSLLVWNSAGDQGYLFEVNPAAGASSARLMMTFPAALREVQVLDGAQGRAELVSLERSGRSLLKRVS